MNLIKNFVLAAVSLSTVSAAHADATFVLKD
jgi:hypothetical protein